MQHGARPSARDARQPAEAERRHGVTPGMSQIYADRTAQQQAAFLLPHLRPGMRLLDFGSGPGTITLGLAEAVAPGEVVGIDHDAKHVETARALAADRGVTNVRFEVADAYDLPFPDGHFDVVYENAVLVHLADRHRAAREISRVLKPGGLFAARDTDADGLIRGGLPDPLLDECQQLLFRWQAQRGSDVMIGKSLPSILREAGFVDVLKSVSNEVASTPDALHDEAEMFIGMLSGNLGRTAVEQGWADQPTIDRMRESWRAWGAHPDSFRAIPFCEAIGRKP